MAHETPYLLSLPTGEPKKRIARADFAAYINRGVGDPCALRALIESCLEDLPGDIMLLEMELRINDVITQAKISCYAPA